MCGPILYPKPVRLKTTHQHRYPLAVSSVRVLDSIISHGNAIRTLQKNGNNCSTGLSKRTSLMEAWVFRELDNEEGFLDFSSI